MELMREVKRTLRDGTIVGTGVIEVWTGDAWVRYAPPGWGVEFDSFGMPTGVYYKGKEGNA